MHPKRWCRYCPQDSDSCKKVAESEGIAFEDVNLDERPEFGRRFKIEMLPAILFTDGKRTRLLQGPWPSEDRIKELLEEFKEMRQDA